MQTKDLNCKKKTALARQVKSRGGSTTIARGYNKGVAKKKSSLISWLRAHPYKRKSKKKSKSSKK